MKRFDLIGPLRLKLKLEVAVAVAVPRRNERQRRLPYAAEAPQ